MLKIALENLLGNAFKFTARCEVARIEFGTAQRNDQTVYFVRDNGAGFNPLRSHQLFGMFQRLHSSTEFEGTGLGLSIAKRIVERHGGAIWAVGAIGEGATFYFTVDH